MKIVTYLHNYNMPFIRSNTKHNIIIINILWIHLSINIKSICDTWFNCNKNKQCSKLKKQTNYMLEPIAKAKITLLTWK
jgi:formiminotetrahydrofolate cyclodeaminase